MLPCCSKRKNGGAATTTLQSDRWGVTSKVTPRVTPAFALLLPLVTTTDWAKKRPVQSHAYRLRTSPGPQSDLPCTFFVPACDASFRRVTASAYVRGSTREVQMVQLLRLPEVQRRVGLSKSTIYSLIARGDFVPSVSISARCRAWPSDAVDSWIQARIANGEKSAPNQVAKRAVANNRPAATQASKGGRPNA